jgi:hypothetical protein
VGKYRVVIPQGWGQAIHRTRGLTMCRTDRPRSERHTNAGDGNDSPRRLDAGTRGRYASGRKIGREGMGLQTTGAVGACCLVLGPNGPAPRNHAFRWPT